MVISEKNMKTIYLALGYKCNHRCTSCPCLSDDKLKEELNYNDIIKKFHDTTGCVFVISGGEPTLYSHFVEVVSVLSNNNFVKVLSNGDRFSDRDFSDQFLAEINIRNVSLTTTLHDYEEFHHERVNNSKGSFKRSISGIRYLNDYGIKVTIKHCITPENYNRIKDFFEFVYNDFPETFDIQISGIDFLGMDKISRNRALKIGNMYTFLDDALEYIDLRYINTRRKISCINIPLCDLDPINWKYCHLSNNNTYNIYVSPKFVNDNYSESRTDIGCFSELCLNCDVSKYCMGTYKSAFDLYGDKLIKPIKIL